MKSKTLILLALLIFSVYTFIIFSSNDPTPTSKSELAPDSHIPLKVVDKPKPTNSNKQEEVISLPDKKIIKNVPFTSQAPFGQWDDDRFQEACEEASILMAMSWVNNQPLTPQIATEKIIDIVDFEIQNYQNFYDHSANDTAQLIKDYYSYQNIFVQHNIGIKDIKTQLAQGNLVIVPINGQKTKNPYYTPPGPDRHQLLIIGYDENSLEFITNDSGTRQGQNYRFSYQEISDAIRDYPTGHKEPILEQKTAMLVIKPKVN